MTELEELDEKIAQWEADGVFSGDWAYQRMLMRRDELLSCDEEE